MRVHPTVADAPLAVRRDSDLRVLLDEIIAVARVGWQVQIRYRMSVFGTSINPFFLFAPLLFMAQSLVGPDGRYRQPFVALTGYENHIGYLVVPLIGATLAHTVFSAIGQLVRQEQISGTLERSLIALRFPIALILGRSIGNTLMLGIFSISAGLLSWLVFDFRLHMDPSAALVLFVLHLLLTYGIAFIMTSLFLWIEDPMFVQQFFSRFVLLTLTGATYPVAILPDWLQVIAWAIPFTWLYDLERRAFLRAEPLPAMFGELIVLIAMTVLVWIGAILFFRTMLRYARRTGRLGQY